MLSYTRCVIRFISGMSLPCLGASSKHIFLTFSYSPAQLAARAFCSSAMVIFLSS